MAIKYRDQFFDYFEQTWSPRPAQPEGYIEYKNRRDIIQHMINNAFEPDLPIARLYGLLFARTLCQADPRLMEEFGEQVAKITRR